MIATEGWRLVRLPCGSLRVAAGRCAPKRRCRARGENAHEPFSRAGNCSVTDATDSLSSPPSAERQLPASAHACATALLPGRVPRDWLSCGSSLNRCLSVKSLGYMTLRYRLAEPYTYPSNGSFVGFWTDSQGRVPSVSPAFPRCEQQRRW